MLSGQVAAITACALSGHLAVTGSSLGEVVLWDLDRTEPLGELVCHQGAVSGCALRPGLLLTTGADGWLRAWSLDHGGLVYALPSGGGALTSLSLSPDGRRAAGGLEDHSAILWDLDQPARLGHLLGHRCEITAVAWTERRVWTGSRDRSIRAWAPAEARDPATTLRHGSSVRACVFSPNGGRLLTATRRGRVRLWEALSGRALWTSEAQGEAIYDVAFSPSGPSLASVGTSGEVCVWDEDHQRTVLSGHQGPVTCCAFVGEDRLLTGGRDHTMRLWDLASSDPPQVLRHHTQAVVGCAISASGTHLASVGLDGELALWCLDSGRREHAIHAHDQPCAGVAIQGDARAFTVAQDRWLRSWDLHDGKPGAALHLTGAQDSVAARPGAVAVGDRSGNLWLLESVVYEVGEGE